MQRRRRARSRARRRRRGDRQRGADQPAPARRRARGGGRRRHAAARLRHRPDDVLTIMFWRDKDMSADVDGAAGRQDLAAAAQRHPGRGPDARAAARTADRPRRSKFVEDPNVTVVVKQINSRKVFITGKVGKPGPYPLTAPTTVLQLIAMAGGLHEYADTRTSSIMRTENGHRQSVSRSTTRTFVKRKNLKQNIELKPGDTVIVP